MPKSEKQSVLTLELASSLNMAGLGTMRNEQSLRSLIDWRPGFLQKRQIDLPSSLMVLLGQLDDRQIRSMNRAFVTVERSRNFYLLGDIRKASVKDLTDVRNLGVQTAKFLLAAVTPPEVTGEEDPYLLSQMPTRPELEDFLRNLRGIPPLYGKRPFYNLVTRKIER